MPQLPSGASEGFLKFLAAKGEIEKGQMAATHLRATQDELNGAKVAAIAHSIKDMDPGTFEQLVVSRDGYIVDGHRRWAAEIGIDAANNRLGDKIMNVARVDSPILPLLKLTDEFTKGAGHKAAEGAIGEACMACRRLTCPNF